MLELSPLSYVLKRAVKPSSRIEIPLDATFVGGSRYVCWRMEDDMKWL